MFISGLSNWDGSPTWRRYVISPPPGTGYLTGVTRIGSGAEGVAATAPGAVDRTVKAMSAAAVARADSFLMTHPCG